MAGQVDYLIVGQGLAGSLLACLLQMRRKDALVIDNAHRTAASLCAAGIMNPITGKRLNRSALIDRLLEDSFSIYPSIERFLGATFFRRRKVLRLMQSAAEHLHWKERLASGDYAKYLGSLDCSCPPSIDGRFGGFEIASAGQLDVAAFIRHTRDMLTATGRLVESEFNSDELQFSKKGVHWRGYTAEAVVFCEGYKLSENPFFKSIQLRPAKGEVLTLRAPSFSDDRILQRGKWLFRSGAEEVKAGTTYAWDWANEMPTQAARGEIEQSIRQFTNFDFEVIHQAAGVRPVVLVDNRPLVGAHPENGRIAVLNGLGSKGVLQAPFAAKQLIGYLEKGEQIHPEFDVCRKSLWKSLEKD